MPDRLYRIASHGTIIRRTMVRTTCPLFCRHSAFSGKALIIPREIIRALRALPTNDYILCSNPQDTAVAASHIPHRLVLFQLAELSYSDSNAVKHRTMRGVSATLIRTAKVNRVLTTFLLRFNQGTASINIAMYGNRNDYKNNSSKFRCIHSSD